MSRNTNITLDDFIFCDLFSRDLTSYGGHTVSSITSLENEENITHMILVGGEVSNCKLNLGISMFVPDSTPDTDIQLSILNKYFDTCYILDKQFLKNEKAILIANSIGGVSSCSEEITKLLNQYNYVSTRDSDYKGNYDIVPDCAVLTKYLFDSKIQLYRDELSCIDTTNKYVALQFSRHEINDNLIETIRNISHFLKIPIYLFVAGIAPHHDSFEEYETILQKIDTPYGLHIFKETNIWKICYIIANSYITIGTSLHVRIIAFCYSKIRFTFSTHISNNSKYNLFIEKWDNIPTSYINTDEIIDTIKLLNDEQVTLFHNKETANLAINDYKTHSEKWLSFF
jgi:hypothetical protein